jgi:hypothetical protein
MAQELLRYQPSQDEREGWLARIAELVTTTNEDPALGNPLGAGEQHPMSGHRALVAENGKAAQAKKAASRAKSSSRGEPSCQIVQHALEEAHVSLEHH